MHLFENLGRALRWLRDRQGKKQYEVAESAGITKGMLCAYETGKQRPSLETLDKLLLALGCDLLALHEALALVSGRYAALQVAAPRPSAPRGAYPLPPPEAGAVSDLPVAGVGEVLRGFHALVRQLQVVLEQVPAGVPPAPDLPPQRRR
ncbi:MAG TPA: helix-turn-helix transcriptional regulator [Thermoanaerobaculia bacterium]|nr:helix-turn-helix transcriptional regulator [Thermoanaerobaculia bacterium]